MGSRLTGPTELSGSNRLHELGPEGRYELEPEVHHELGQEDRYELDREIHHELPVPDVAHELEVS